jgi:hypothetical protein
MGGRRSESAKVKLCGIHGHVYMLIYKKCLLACSQVLNYILDSIMGEKNSLTI